MTDALRAHVAWLLWCANQGYLNAVDRALTSNMFLEDPAGLHPDDLAERPHWLAMADEVLAAVRVSRTITTEDIDAVEQALRDVSSRYHNADSRYWPRMARAAVAAMGWHPESPHEERKQ